MSEMISKLVKATARCAEDRFITIQNWDKLSLPVFFKPGTSDKLIFRRIIEENFEIFARDYQKIFQYDEAYTLLLGIATLRHYYCPNFQWWDERELKLAREESGANEERASADASGREI